MVHGRPDPDSQSDAFGSASTKRHGKKAPDAYRTISEVADLLHVPQHVLRFWETRFDEVCPLKSGGGRRYYSPEQIELLRRISELLYVEGYTIKGVQRVLKGNSESTVPESSFGASDFVPAIGFAEDSAAPFLYQSEDLQKYQQGPSESLKPGENQPQEQSESVESSAASSSREAMRDESKPVHEPRDTRPIHEAEESKGGSQELSAQITQLKDKHSRLVNLLQDVRVELVALRKNL